MLTGPTVATKSVPTGTGIIRAGPFCNPFTGGGNGGQIWASSVTVG